MKKLTTFILALLFLAGGAFSQAAQSEPAAIKYFTNKDGAIRGYDPVAYFTQQKAVKGMEEFKYEWSGSSWYFSSQENREAFAKSPEKYAPQFGGYCAYGVSEDHKSPTDPTAFTIVDDKLYLNYNNKVKELWFPKKEERIATANKLWPALNQSN
jgi:YHS domain-containing protein